MNKFRQSIIAKKLKQELSTKGGIVSVDKVACDGCGICVGVCPSSAIAIKTLTSEEVGLLPLKGRFKVLIKGRDKAIIDQNLCTACGLCMKQCHEFALHKVKQS